MLAPGQKLEYQGKSASSLIHHNVNRKWIKKKNKNSEAKTVRKSQHHDPSIIAASEESSAACINLVMQESVESRSILRNRNASVLTNSQMMVPVEQVDVQTPRKHGEVPRFSNEFSGEDIKSNLRKSQHHQNNMSKFKTMNVMIPPRD